ncbi:nose resistant to fluoxetine protein 6-like [Daktulosphaira vitifoliae]|uniref:nose resistant to fluoxetine protein 6-like n=1 Tax=Daktulosphaira vitifoliae TaxID=58002 RepID=UPI0021AA2C63|nr:nose resistant to fluoxetine protein 6-like [Daktulosphaira vitifoliae]
MKVQISVVFVLILNSAWGTRLESVPFKFYEELSIESESVTEQCRNYVKIVLDGVKNMNSSALKMVDSTAKIPSGMLRGNVNQFGDFDECINIDDNELTGKYCLAAIQFKLHYFDDEIHAYHQLKNNLTDLNHRIPKFSTIYWGVCVPSTCTPDDVSFAIKSATDGLIDLEVLVENDLCQQKRIPVDQKTPLWLTLFFAILFGFLTSVGQGVIFCSEEIDPDLQKCAPFILRLTRALRNSFSPSNNIKMLFSPTSNSSLRSIDGIRVFNMVALLLSHMTMAKLFLPYLNKTELSENMSKPWYVIGRVAALYTDSFLIISGLLAAYTLSRSSPFKNIISRYVRLTATMAVVITYSTIYLPGMNNGPMWNMVITKPVEICNKNWWKNVLYIQNWFGFENMCFTNTYQLAVDFQLYILAIPLIYLLRKHKPLAISIITTLITFSTIKRYQVVKSNELASLVYFGVNFSQLHKTFNLTYTSSSHRATVYLMGLLVGYWMQQKGRLNLTPAQVKKTWFVAIICGLLAIFGPYPLSNKSYVYNSTHLALFNSISPILWSIFILWLIIANNNGYDGWFGNILCWSAFTPLSKISYAVYLVQYPVFFYFVGTARGSSFYNITSIFDISQVIIIGLLSTLLTLTVDMPFQKIGKYIAEGHYGKIKLY